MENRELANVEERYENLRDGTSLPSLNNHKITRITITGELKDCVCENVSAFRASGLKDYERT